MGGEIGQYREWHHDTSIDWHLQAEPLHAGVQKLVQDLNRLHKGEAALHERDNRRRLLVHRGRRPRAKRDRVARMAKDRRTKS